MAERLGFKEGTNGRNGMVVATVLGCYVPSCAILPANVPNMVLAGATESLYNLTFSYGSYIKLHYPVVGLMNGGILILLTCYLFPDRIRPNLSIRHLPLGSFKKSEWVLMFVLSGTLLLWGTDFLHGISPAWVGLGAALVCMLPFKGILPTDAFSRRINFGPFFYVAGVLGVSAVVVKSGLGEVLGKALLQLIEFKLGHDWRNFMSLVLLQTAVSPVTTAPGLPSVMVPLSADIAKATGFPLTTVLMTQVIGFSNLILPYQVPPVVVGMQLGGVKATVAAKATLTLTVVSILVLTPVNYLWWHFLGKFGNAP
jgi:di/tricarboxylate transporter